MATLDWVSSLPNENCFRAEGDETTWLIWPSVVDGKWSLWSVAKNSTVISPVDAGLFASLGQARAAAQKAESGDRLPPLGYRRT